jgi:hypothetical protein
MLFAKTICMQPANRRSMSAFGGGNCLDLAKCPLITRSGHAAVRLGPRNGAILETLARWWLPLL